MAERKMIYLDDAIAALKAMAIPLHQDPCCEDIWERDRTLDNAIDAMRGLPSAQPEQRWIPCSERMPEYDKPVLLSTAWCKTEIGFWTQRGWMIVACSYREFEQDAVTAWMPLPEPYAERRQE